MNSLLNPSDGSLQGATFQELSPQEFEAKAIKGSQEKPTLVYFWAPWCGPCKQYQPTLTELAQKVSGAITLYKVNADEAGPILQMMRVQSLPMLLLFKGGQPALGIPGVHPLFKILEALKAHVPEIQLGPDPRIEEAWEALYANDLPKAFQQFSELHLEDPQSQETALGLFRVHMAGGHLDTAKEVLGDTQEWDSQLANIRGNPRIFLTLAEKTLKEDEDPCVQGFATGGYEAAVAALVQRMSSSTPSSGSEAHEKLLDVFAALGAKDPVTNDGRRAISKVLFK